jgi:membrane associated rhomboid family serine protease
MTEQFRPRGFSILPAVVKNLLILNILVFLAQKVAEYKFGISLEDKFGLHYPKSTSFAPWQFVTYMFLHGNFTHILFNMFALWMFGNSLENVWGPRRFLLYYFITGIGAGLIQCLVTYIDINPTVSMIEAWMINPDPNAISNYFHSQYSNLPQNFNDAIDILKQNPGDKHSEIIIRNFLGEVRQAIYNQPVVIGASGAVYGILLAFGMLFPNAQMILIFFPFYPIKAKYAVIGFGLLELFFGFTGLESGIAHFAHLGGMIFGFFLILYWKKKGRLY